MDIQLKCTKISQLLTKWYEQNKRDLPWRHTSDPYIIWVSEIILQQTRVDQGYAYFERFVKEFPNVKTLALADEEDVLLLWQGLGYYSRARNLHAAAKDILTRFDGVFPDNHRDVLSLKGVGEYTAAAIVSFAYNHPYAVVDGNVYRVLSRLFAISEPIDSTLGRKTFALLAQELLDKNSPGIHNQAMMELGALQCTPFSPKCIDCPVISYCFAHNSDLVSLLPVKQGKTKLKERFFNYLDIRCDSDMFLNKRTGNDIWKNLYELPLIETDRSISLDELQTLPEFHAILKDAGSVVVKPTSIMLKHVLSHRIIHARFYEIQITDGNHISKSYTKTSSSQLSKYPISRLVDKYFEKRS